MEGEGQKTNSCEPRGRREKAGAKGAQHQKPVLQWTLPRERTCVLDYTSITLRTLLASVSLRLFWCGVEVHSATRS